MFKLEALYYRSRQFCLSGFMSVVPYRRAKVVSGAGCVYKIPEMLKRSGYKKVMVMTTPGFIRRGSLKGLLERFQREEIRVTIFSHVTPDPSSDCVEEAETAYMQTGCEAIVAVGGGSVMDCAKALGARAVHPEKNLTQMSGLLRVRKHLPDLYAVPTTAGTGSEATAAAVITDARAHYKYTMLDWCLIPRYAVLDPEFSAQMPKHITAYTGMDALTHAVEAYTNRFCAPKVKKTALMAVKQISQSLVGAYEDGSNRNHRRNMLMAAYNAGLAINGNFVGYVHALAHAIGGIYGIPHGKAVAVLLPHVLESYGRSVEKKLAELADAAGLEGESRRKKAEAFIAYIREINKQMEIPEKFEELNEKDFPEIIKRTLHEANPGYPVPVIWKKRDVERVLREVSSMGFKDGYICHRNS